MSQILPVQGIRTLTLAVHDVALGRFEAIETFCVDHALVFARWAGGAPGAFGPERVVFDGTTVRRFSASDDDEILISAETVRGLGSYAAVLSHLAAAELEVPRSESTAEAEGKAKPVGVDTSPPEDAAYPRRRRSRRDQFAIGFADFRQRRIGTRNVASGPAVRLSTDKSAEAPRRPAGWPLATDCACSGKAICEKCQLYKKLLLTMSDC
ncbi:hypothetical protein ATE69_15810 [Sphingopyxis sp. H071]|uniref:hypothetical protein n=1 Tax=Sphingopyxis TaxID=165697 RepID=UPI0007300E32|nr:MULTISPECIES: hypothetical protein [Sphingopyxis]KTE50803.1 hypothetical protein ATE64_15870 [Sphingopyxis sp. H073]KTE51788.1 hypothetical protein ATE69_15810 [Sphingopyxis sp. H071]KTE78674.1 hypothetical protein ATE59_02305 [Sphingopyxis sp. A083]